jgi:hypothetical protein
MALLGDASLNDIARKAISIRPERTRWAPASFGIVDAFFMRAADDAVDSNDALRALALQEGADAFENRFISPNVSGFQVPLLQRLWVSAFGLHYRHNDFASTSVVWSVVRDGCDGVTPKTLLLSLPELVALPLRLEGHSQQFSAQRHC